METILRPLEGPYSAEVARLLDDYPRRDGYLLMLFRVFANSTRFLRKGVFNLLDKESPLLLRERELVILRVTANLRCEYEWGVHVAAFAKAAKFTAEQIDATLLSTRNTHCWSESEAQLIDVVDQFCRVGKLEEKTLENFERLWSLEQQLEIIALCGNYHTVSFVANTARLPPEPFAARFSDSGDREKNNA